MTSFNETGLSPEILKAIGELGFEQPTPIQQKTIPALLNTNQDIIALAQTGTGKTAAFGLPVIHLTDTDSREVQSLILCPTRELCIQITKDLENYAKYKKVKILPVYGGTNIVPQLKALKSGAHIVVGTPGRVTDLIKRRALKIDHIQWMVLDEADEMLNMGFKEDLDTILAETPDTKQTLLFSATMPREMAQMSKKYMTSPNEITVGNRNESSQNISHEYYMVDVSNRYLALKRIADIHPSIYGIVFCRTRQETKDVANQLIHDGYSADAIHGDLSQDQRDLVMNKFRLKQLQILVATDVAARGLDVNCLTHVINYNLPDDLEVYIHRSGRTGRAGNTGTSISIVPPRDMGKIRSLEKMARKKFEVKQVPTGQAVCEKQLFNLIDKVEQIEVNNSQIDQFMPAIYQKLDWLSREDLIKHFVSAEFNQFLSYYKDAPDLNVKARKSDAQRSRGRRNAYSRFFINAGEKTKMNVPTLLNFINKHNETRGIEIGRVDILKNFSFFEIETGYENEIQNAFNGANHGGVKLFVEPANKKESGRGNRGGRDSRDKRKKKRPAFDRR